MREILTHRHLRVVAHDSASEIPEDIWDSFGGGFYSSRRWATYQERDPCSDAWVIAVYDVEHLVAVTPVYHVLDEANSAYDLPIVLGRTTPARSSFLCGNRRGYDNQLLAVPGRQDVLDALLQGLVAEARASGADVAWWPYLDDDSVGRLRTGAPMVDPWLLQVTAELVLPPGGFDTFLASLSKNQRGKVRRDRRLFAAANRTISCERADPRSLEVAAELVTNVERKHGSHTTSDVIRDLLEGQVIDVGDRAALITCRDESGPIACSMAYWGTSQLAVRVAGLDHDRVGSAAEYFETVYYRSIDLAHRLGLRTVSLGFGSLEAKRHRGAVLRPRWGLPLMASGSMDGGSTRGQIESSLARIELEERVTSDMCASPLLDSVLGT